MRWALLAVGAALGAPQCTGNRFRYCRYQALPCDFAAFPAGGPPPAGPHRQPLRCRCEGGAGRRCAAEPYRGCYPGAFPGCADGHWECS